MTAMPVIDAISGMPVSIAGVGVRETLFEVLLRDLAGVPAETAVGRLARRIRLQRAVGAARGLVFLEKRDRIHVSELGLGSDDGYWC